MKKIILFTLMLVSFTGSRIHGQESGGPYSISAFHLDSEGKISGEFWKYDPLGESMRKERPLKIMGDEKVWSLIQSLPAGYSVEGNEDHDPKGLETYEQLKKMGFHLFGTSQKPEKLDERLRLWEWDDNSGFQVYLIDTKPPIRVFYLNGIYEVGSPTVFLVGKLTDDIYRIYMGGMINNGTRFGQSKEKLLDVNLSKGTKQEMEFNGFFDSKGKDKTVILKKMKVDEGSAWTWIYKWDGSKWNNVSDLYPEYYKTVVLKELQKGGLNEDKQPAPALPALIEAAKKGGPSVFMKQ